MTPSARIQAAIELWEKIWAAGVPMDSITGDYFRVRRYVGSSDRQAIANRVYEMMRSYGRVSWHLAHIGAQDTPRVRALADLALREGTPKPHVADLFSGAGHAPAPLEGAELEILDKLSGQSLEHADMDAASKSECPPDAFERLSTLFGEHFDEEMAAMLTPAALDIRVNSIKGTRERVQQSLAKANIETEFTPYSPVGLRAQKRAHLASTKLLQAGVIDIQDEGSQLIAFLCGAKPGMQVLDACAGGGGKTLAIAAQMEGKGRVVAMDNNTRRLQNGKPRYVRAGIHNVEIRSLEEPKHIKWLRRQKGNFDVVLVDAPCSSSGTWRRNPDLRWRRAGPSLEDIITLQGDILGRFAKSVKPGGRLVYATCSLFREENEDQIVRFLEAHPEFKLKPIGQIWAQSGLNGTCPYAGDVMRLSPLSAQTDGFFAAVLEREAAPEDTQDTPEDEAF